MLVEKSVLVSHSAQQMFSLVERVEDYPAFLPWCSGAKVLTRELEADGIERVGARLDINFHGVKQSFTTLNRQRAGDWIEIHLQEGPFKKLEGAWLFKPLTAQACKVEFCLQYEFSSRLLSNLIVPVFNQIAASFVEGFVRRAEQCYSS